MRKLMIYGEKILRVLHYHILNHCKKKFFQPIKRICPYLGIESCQDNQEGLFNLVLLVDEELVLRFARDQAGEQVLSKELNILNLIQPQLPVVIPNPFYISNDCIV
jgi:hypothetical protein